MKTSAFVIPLLVMGALVACRRNPPPPARPATQPAQASTDTPAPRLPSAPEQPTQVMPQVVMHTGDRGPPPPPLQLPGCPAQAPAVNAPCEPPRFPAECEYGSGERCSATFKVMHCNLTTHTWERLQPRCQ